MNFSKRLLGFDFIQSPVCIFLLKIPKVRKGKGNQKRKNKNITNVRTIGYCLESFCIINSDDCACNY